jgi:hypothetical protein
MNKKCAAGKLGQFERESENKTLTLKIFIKTLGSALAKKPGRGTSSPAPLLIFIFFSRDARKEKNKLNGVKGT